jgi:hypothetical protein
MNGISPEGWALLEGFNDYVSMRGMIPVWAGWTLVAGLIVFVGVMIRRSRRKGREWEAAQQAARPDLMP